MSSPRPLTASLAFAASLLTAACADRAAPTAPSRDATASLRAPRGATGTGAIVARGPLPLGFILYDDVRQLVSIIGFTTEELRAFCAGGPQPQVVDALTVTRPTGAVLLRFTGEVSVVVWPLVSEDPCVLAATPPLAEGTARWQGMDNEYSGVGPGASSYGSVARGTVTSAASGATLRYLALVRVVISPTGEVRVPTAQIKLR